MPDVEGMSDLLTCIISHRPKPPHEDARKPAESLATTSPYLEKNP